MAFKLSQRSLDRLEGVHPDLVAVVKEAINLTRVDFGVTCGTRTVEEQEKLVAAGKSQTMNSKHLPQEDGYSHAVDLVAYVGSDVAWELNLYDDICDAMGHALTSLELDTSILWGAAWSEGDIKNYFGNSETAMNTYIDLRRSEGRRPFLDGPHFELMM
jgi:peptidoglycan L-alanyl-D-glutamate endopeptidase CwlK